MNFVGAGHLNGGVGNVYMLPKPGIIKDNGSVFEVTIGSPEGDAISLPEKMRYFLEESHYSSWFKNAKRVAANSAILDFRTPLVTPAKGRTLVAGDAAAFIETYVQGALIYGRSAGKVVIGKIKEGKDFSEYLNLWKDTFGYNQPGEIEKSTQAYGISSFSDDELDYIFGLTEGEKREGYVNEFNDFERIMGAFYAHIETMKKERPELADKLESHFGKSEVRDSLQLTKNKK
jgi:flavin-dependent dehydrogenase